MNAGALASSATSRAVGPVAHASDASGCGTIAITPSSNLKVGDEVTITGADWNPNKGQVALYYPNISSKQGNNRPIANETVNKNGQFTDQFTLIYFNSRATYPTSLDPNQAGGCFAVVTAQQGSHPALARATSPGIGHVAYALYRGTKPPFTTRDQYCLGENPVGNAGDSDIVVTVPAKTSPPAPGLTPYQVAATPLGINLRGGTGGSRVGVVPGLYVGGSLCLSPGRSASSILITADAQVGAIAPCPAVAPSVGPYSPGVKRFGMTGLSGTSASGCLGLALHAGTHSNPKYGPNTPLRFKGNLDCNENHFVSGTTLDIERPIFVDGSLYVRSPFVNVGDGTGLAAGVITAGSFAESAGIFVAPFDPVIVGTDATFGLGPPTRGMSDAQKAEIRVAAKYFGYASSTATHSGTILGTISAFAKLTPGVKTAVDYVSLAASWTSSLTDISGRILDAFADDPPDRDYRTLARPASFGHVPTVKPGKGLSTADARILHLFFRGVDREAGIGVALETAVDRAAGAADAGNTHAERLQIAAAVRYALSYAKLLDAQPRLFAASARVLRSLPAGRFRPTVKQEARARKTLLHHGFSAQSRAQARSAGITSQELKLDRLILLSSPDLPRQSVAEIIGSPALASTARKVAVLARDFAKSAPATVGLREALMHAL